MSEAYKQRVGSTKKLKYTQPLRQGNTHTKSTHLHRLRPPRPHVPQMKAPIPVPSTCHIPPAWRNAGVDKGAKRLFFLLSPPCHPTGLVDERRVLPCVHSEDRHSNRGDKHGTAHSLQKRCSGRDGNTTVELVYAILPRIILISNRNSTYIRTKYPQIYE